MEAKVINFAQWKASHPPALICLNHGLAAMLAWQKLWMRLFMQKPF